MLVGGLGKVKGVHMDVPNMREDICSLITPPNLALPGLQNALRSALFLEISPVLLPVFDHALRIQIPKNVYDAKTAVTIARLFHSPRYTPKKCTFTPVRPFRVRPAPHGPIHAHSHNLSDVQGVPQVEV